MDCKLSSVILSTNFCLLPRLCQPLDGMLAVKEEENPISVQLADLQTHHYLASPLDD